MGPFIPRLIGARIGAELAGVSATSEMGVSDALR